MKIPDIMLVATRLTIEDLLDVFIEIARKLTWKLEETTKDRDSWKSTFEMYRDAVLREMGGKLINKHHDIDAFVLTVRFHYENSQLWLAHQNRLQGLNKDPFWDVPEFKEKNL
jgi:hypothetical protein